MPQTTTYHEDECSPGERVILARFATRVRRAGRRGAERLTHGAFVAL